MNKGDKAAIVCCSNGQQVSNAEKIKQLQTTLEEIGIKPILSEYIYEKEDVFSGTGEERAKSLMDFYKDGEIKAIFDISGGDIANEILPYLDFDVIAQSEKQFWGYSDLTTILNAIYAKTGKTSVLYQVRNLIYQHAAKQVADFTSTIFTDDVQLYEKSELFDFSYKFVQGKEMKGIVVGGNIRCLLKLAGTEYFPDMTGKILLLEAYGGLTAQMVTYLNQLKQMGVFDKINGILLGTFTKMEETECRPTITELVKRYAGEKLPIAKTAEIGHGTDAKGIIIGQELTLN